MNLIIDNPDNLDLDKFCMWLRQTIVQYAYENIDERKIKRFNDYVNTKASIKWLNNKQVKINCKNIILAGFHNMEYSKTADKYIFEFNIKDYIPNSSAKFIDIIKFVNYGNLVVNSYPIVTDILNYFANNLQQYYNLYLREI